MAQHQCPREKKTSSLRLGVVVESEAESWPAWIWDYLESRATVWVIVCDDHSKVEVQMAHAVLSIHDIPSTQCMDVVVVVATETADKALGGRDAAYMRFLSAVAPGGLLCCDQYTVQNSTSFEGVAARRVEGTRLQTVPANINSLACVDRERLVRALKTARKRSARKSTCSGDSAMHLLRAGVHSSHRLPDAEADSALDFFLDDISFAVSPKKASSRVDALFVFAHPDDEAMFAGGTIATLVQKGYTVQIITITGSRGASLRGAEQIAGLEALGLHDAVVHTLNAPDFGKYKDKAKSKPHTAASTLKVWNKDALVQELASLIKRLKPRLVFSFDSLIDPSLSLHGHHGATGALLITALAVAADTTCMHSWCPDALWTALPPCLLERKKHLVISVDEPRVRTLKRAAVSAHTSQWYSTQAILTELDDSERAHLEVWRMRWSRSDSIEISKRKGVDALVPLDQQQVETQAPKPTIESQRGCIPLDKQSLLPENDADAVRIMRSVADSSSIQHKERLCAALARSSASQSGAVAESLAKLRLPSTVAVVTGQQCGFLGGPVLTLVKALHAVALAKELERRRIFTNVVPIFWACADDHDFREAISSGPDVLMLNNSKIDLVRVADISMGPHASEFKDLLSRVVGDHRASELTQPQVSLSRHFIDLFAELVGSQGMLLLDPTDPDIIDLAKSLLQLEVDNFVASGIVAASVAAASSPDDRRRFCVDNSQLGCFAVNKEGRRLRVNRTKPGLFTVAASPLSKDCVACSVTAKDLTEQYRLSPRWYLRPVLQDFLLPTVAYIAGPTEERYLNLLGPLYSHFGVSQPLVLKRHSLTAILEVCLRETLEQIVTPRLGTSSWFDTVQAIHEDRDTTLERLVQSYRPLGVSAAIGQIVENEHGPFQLNDVVTSLNAALATHGKETDSARAALQEVILANAKVSGPRGKVKLKPKLKKLVRKIDQHSRKRGGVAISAFETIMPWSAPQDRWLNVCRLVAGWQTVPEASATEETAVAVMRRQTRTLIQTITDTMSVLAVSSLVRPRHLLLYGDGRPSKKESIQKRLHDIAPSMAVNQRLVLAGTWATAMSADNDMILNEKIKRISIVCFGRVGASTMIAVDWLDRIMVASKNVSLIVAADPEPSVVEHCFSRGATVSVIQDLAATPADGTSAKAVLDLERNIVNSDLIIVHHGNLLRPVLAARDALLRQATETLPHIICVLHCIDVPYGPVSWSLLDDLNRTECVVCVSNSLRERVLAFLDKAVVIESPLPSYATPSAFDGQRRSEIFGDADVAIVISGNFRAMKRPLVAIRAVALARVELSKSSMRTALALIGDGELLRPAKDVAKDSVDHLMACGALSRYEAIRAVACADILLVSSTAESGCLSALEAMACGVPVVSTRNGGFDELVLDTTKDADDKAFLEKVLLTERNLDDDGSVAKSLASLIVQLVRQKEHYARAQRLCLSAALCTQEKSRQGLKNVFAGIGQYLDLRMSRKSKRVVKRVALIGGGIAALEAATYLRRNEILDRIVIYEKTKRLGGVWTTWATDDTLVQTGAYAVAGLTECADRATVLAAVDVAEKKLETCLSTEISHIRASNDCYELLRVDGHAIEAKYDAVWSFCGRWQTPRLLPELEGESEFVANGGMICRHPQSPPDCAGQAILIIGHGAFAVECARASLERGAERVFLIDRNKSGACPVAPRLASYALNATPGPLSPEELTTVAAPFLKMLPEQTDEVAARAVADWYFLACSCGKLEIFYESTVKRLESGKAIIESGDSTLCKVKADVVIACIGFEPPPPDSIEPIVGLWVLGDPLRPVWRESYRSGDKAEDYWATSSIVALSALVPIFADALRRPVYWKNLLSALHLPVAKRDCDWTSKHVSRTVHLLRHSAPLRIRRLLQSSEEKRSGLVTRLTPPELFLKDCLTEWQYWCKILKSKEEYPISGLDDLFRKAPRMVRPPNASKSKMATALIRLAQTQFQADKSARLETGNYVAPKSPSPEFVVRKTLADLHGRGALLAAPGQPAVVADLGCGDGRWLIEACGKYGCIGIGMDIDETMLARAQRNIDKANLKAFVQLHKVDFFSENAPHLGKFDVVIAYLFRAGCKLLESKLETELKAGATVVCVGFGLPQTWRPISECREAGLVIRLYEKKNGAGYST